MNELMDPRFYEDIKSILENTRNQVYSVANSAMVQAYWNIGKNIVEQQKKENRAEYGKKLLQELSKQLTADFGKGFTASNLRNMRQFYLTFPNCYALRSNLSWTHYRMLMRIENEVIAKYSVLNDGNQLFASKYQLTLPTAEELEKYIENERRKYEEREDIL